MGTGIAAALAASGIPTTVLVRRAEAVESARGRVAERLAARRALRLPGGAEAEEAVSVTLAVADDSAELVIECVQEDAGVKRRLLASLEGVLTADGILTTSTSSLRIDDLASDLARPDRLVGWHWFHPADLVPLVEVVSGPKTDPSAAMRVREWSALLGKAPLSVLRDVPGFVANRLQYALLREAYALVEAGVCTVEDVDLAVTAGLGARWAAVGPFELMDLAGLDVHAAAAEALFPVLDRSTTVPRTLSDLRGAGALGIKNGRGLRGSYSPSAARSAVARRDRALAVAAGRPGR